MSSQNRDQLTVLDALLVEVLELKETGGPHARLAHAQGYADGYMRLLLDTKLATQAELLRLVNEVRTRFYGPALVVAAHPNERDDSMGAAA